MWRQRGLDGTLEVSGSTRPAALIAGVIAVELLVHGWYLARATAQEITAGPTVCEYVLGLARDVVTPQIRDGDRFAAEVDVPPGADALTDWPLLPAEFPDLPEGNMKSQETWKYIHAERAHMADTLGTLSADQWTTSLVVRGLDGQRRDRPPRRRGRADPVDFYKELIQAGFRFDVFTDRGARRLGALDGNDLVRRLRARTTTTNHPPAPVMAMLGEIVVHGEDIRRPLGLEHRSPEAALVAIADSWKKSNLLIGSKRRIAGLRLGATDCDGATARAPKSRARWCHWSWP